MPLISAGVGLAGISKYQLLKGIILKYQHLGSFQIDIGIIRNILVRRLGGVSFSLVVFCKKTGDVLILLLTQNIIILFKLISQFIATTKRGKQRFYFFFETAAKKPFDKPVFTPPNFVRCSVANRVYVSEMDVFCFIVVITIFKIGFYDFKMANICFN